MKSALIIPLTLLSTLAVLAAKDDPLPKIPADKAGRWSVFSVEDAKKEALKKKQPIAFVATDERAEEKAIKDAALIAFWGLEKECTMVLLPSTTAGQWKERLPEVAYKGVTAKEIAKDYPRVVVLDQTASTIIGSMGMSAIIDGGEKVVKEFTKQMKETNKDPEKIAAAAAAAAAATPAEPAAAAKPAAATPAAAAAPAPAATGPVAIKDGKPEAWTSAAGSTIQATLLEVDGDTASLATADGRKLSVPVSSLSPASQKRVEELKAASSK